MGKKKTEAFKLVKGKTAFLDGNHIPCKVRIGTLGHTKDRLYVETGMLFRPLTHIDGDFYEDEMGRGWTIKTV